MTDTVPLKLSNVLYALVALLLAAAVYGLTQDPRPEWSRSLPTPASLFLISAASLRRGRAAK